MNTVVSIDGIKTEQYLNQRDDVMWFFVSQLRSSAVSIIGANTRQD